ncbi:MAG TPA: glycosyltransferase family 2 protein [Edaphobacter sp.]|nr:glycosyltransferase family 2 protein [Edaphobacter sp.]
MLKVIIPTLNAAAIWRKFSFALLQCTTPDKILIIDSSSTDSTLELALAAGFQVHTIPRAEFNHGNTRQLAVELLPEADILVFLTQDAVLAASDALNTLLSAFTDQSVAAAFGRQLSRLGATPIEQHARLFNYPHESSVRALESREHLGFKSIFISNSFAAYRREALMAVGGFPHDVIFGEDTITAAKLLLAGWKIAYVAEAQVYHSHSYTWRQEFRRYFDIGVLHSREQWLLNEFGQVSGEGKRFVLSELRYLWPKHISMIPSALIRTALKFTGYRLGRSEQKLSPAWKRRLSMNRSYWK